MNNNGKYNIVYTKRVAGTVSQVKIDELRKFMVDNPKQYIGVWNIQINRASKDEDIAKVLMLQHEVIEEEDLEMEIEEVSYLDS